MITKANILLCLLFLILQKATFTIAKGYYQYECKQPWYKYWPKHCPLYYKPVCAYLDVYCVKEPCPSYATYDNACLACRDPDVVGWYEGECICKPYYEYEPELTAETEAVELGEGGEIISVDNGSS